MMIDSLRRLSLLTLLIASLAACAAVTTAPASAQGWHIADRENDELPGRRIDIRHGDRLVASFIYGEGQMKTYLHVYGEDGERLTNPGIDKDGKEAGRFPHHRGIFIGWNKMQSNLGSDDLWHLRRGERMSLASIDKINATNEAATLVLTLHWNSQKTDDDQKGLLVSEQRTFVITRPENKRTQIDVTSVLTAARDVKLQGDLQHAGTHFRARAEVDNRRSETRYLWEPADLAPGNGRIISDDLKWVNFHFPIKDAWYQVTQLNHPDNGTTELSWRDYGRFGFFFTRDLKKGDTLPIHHRFLIERVSKDDESAARAAAQGYYNAYVN